MGGSSSRRFRQTAARLVALVAVAAAAGCGNPTPTDQPIAQSPERAQFDAIFRDWKPFLAELRRVREEYALADPDRQVELKERYDEMVAKGKVMEQDLFDAAVLTCVKQPQQNDDLVAFLLGVMWTQINLEDYEDALKTAQILIEQRVGTFDDQVDATFCGINAGSAVCEFDVVADRLRFLDEEYVRLTGSGNPYIQLIDQCREDLIYTRAAWEKEQKIREQERLAGDLPRVLLKTNKGDVELELFENEAPNTVANFIDLVEKRFYNGLTFHRVVKFLAAQGGCPNNDGSGDPGYTIRSECRQRNRRLHFRGSLSMADQGLDTGGCQFFITFRPARHLDGKHTVFGRVVRGVEVLARLQRREVDPENTDPGYLLSIPEADKILEARVLRMRNHPYKPKYTPKPKQEDLPPQVPLHVQPLRVRPERQRAVQ
ncbi:MAG: peptidylprolyl isomerase [Planctomycetota bacterium]|jgi:cyclophilin family peptidyl-prolyl cis-trans isomerase